MENRPIRPRPVPDHEKKPPAVCQEVFRKSFPGAGATPVSELRRFIRGKSWMT